MAPAYKLTYFNLRGMAETIRYIFAYANVDYEDFRIEKENWPEWKSKMPFGKVPVLEMNGEVLSESKAIARYLAREFDLAGKNNLESAKCDMLTDAMTDIFYTLVPMRMESDEAKKAELLKQFFSETLPPALTNFSRILEKNNGGTAFIVGDKITWADLGISYGLECLCNLDSSALDKFPLLKAHKERISNIPSVKAWIAKRPVTHT